MHPVLPESTIAAISTPPGAGGIGIIRISGERSLPILRTLFLPKNQSCSYQSHRLYYGHLTDPKDGRIIDEVLAVYMAAPHTYTREDLVEIHCHGSHLLLERVLEQVLAKGAELAEPGEFTKRAFLNGRIDLTQAEAVIDILSAKTKKGVDLAQEQLAGGLFRRLEPIRQSLTEMRALLEVAIDFPDEDVEIADHGQLLQRLRDEVLDPLKKLKESSEQGAVFREGVRLVIAGLPNVGKSSLLNTMLNEERALVTSVPGTTRDSIEEILDIYGVPVRLIDTAGIRHGAGEVEELGIKRARDLINSADLVLFMLDASRPVNQEEVDLYLSLQGKPMIRIANKSDLLQPGQHFQPDLPGTDSWLHISAREGDGVDALKKAIFRHATGGREQWEEAGCAPNLRHRKALERALLAVEQVTGSLEVGLTNDLLAVDLKECLDQLAEIVGETTTEDILDVIFAQFCLGK